MQVPQLSMLILCKKWAFRDMCQFWGQLFLPSSLGSVF